MSILTDVREAVELAQKADNIDLYRRVLDLQGEVQELVQEKRDLEDDVRDLREALAFSETLEAVGDVYVAREDREITDGPFCTRCWDVEGRAVRLRDATRQERNFVGGGAKVCPECENAARPPEEVREALE